MSDNQDYTELLKWFRRRVHEQLLLERFPDQAKIDRLKRIAKIRDHLERDHAMDTYYALESLDNDVRRFVSEVIEKLTSP